MHRPDAHLTVLGGGKLCMSLGPRGLTGIEPCTAACRCGVMHSGLYRPRRDSISASQANGGVR